jgi:hypothetical protein
MVQNAHFVPGKGGQDVLDVLHVVHATNSGSQAIRPTSLAHRVHGPWSSGARVSIATEAPFHQAGFLTIRVQPQSGCDVRVS